MVSGASFVATALLLPKAKLRSDPFPRVQWMPEFERPGPDSFFAFTVGDELSQTVLVHDLGESIDNARRADVLFVGNSRMPLGLREEVIVPAADELGVRAFSLACGHSDKVSLALELIRRHDLRPKVVVVSGGPHVFVEGLSDNARRALESSRWEAWKRWMETRARWAIQSRVHRVVPKLDDHGDRLTSAWIFYRSERTGWWQPMLEPTGGIPIQVVADLPSYEYTLPLARELLAELEARGSQLVITIVPYGDTRVGHLPFLAERLGVPMVLPPFDGLQLADGSHLNRDSALRYSRAFWERFERLPEVRRRLALDPGQPPVP